ncbi:hypothetical protein QUF75_08430 [Desulfococcaceae bacterium HSG7]|nr:hypothetical protein [Desulfococcaceae bacterium HSG7]
MKNFSRICFITLIIACFIFVSFINGFAAAYKFCKKSDFSKKSDF